LKTHVQNLGHPLRLLIGIPETTFLDDLQLKGKFNGLYLWNETRYRQPVKCVTNCKGSPISFQKDMNFGPQTV